MRWASEKDKTAYIKGETWKFKPVSYFLHTSKYIFFKETRIVSKDFSLNLKKKKKDIILVQLPNPTSFKQLQVWTPSSKTSLYRNTVRWALLQEYCLLRRAIYYSRYNMSMV